MDGRPAASTSWSSIGMKPPIITLSLVVVNSGDGNSVGLCVEIQNWMLLIGFMWIAYIIAMEPFERLSQKNQT